MPESVVLPSRSMAECFWPLSKKSKILVNFFLLHRSLHCLLMEGGMVRRVEEYKRRLEASLDAEFNVKDMATVVECIELLEKLPNIDAQILMNTRIGKIVNDLRRKLPPEEATFSRRLKKLAKTWLIIANVSAASQPPPPSPANGRTLTRVDELKRDHPPSVRSNSKPNSPIAQNGGHLVSPSSQPAVSGSPQISLPEESTPPSASATIGGKKITIKFGGRLVGNSGSAAAEEPVAKRQKTAPQSVNQPLTRATSQANSPSLSHVESSAMLESVLRNSVPASRVKVKTHEELLASFELSNPGVVSLDDVRHFSSNVSRDASVIPVATKNRGKKLIPTPSPAEEVKVLNHPPGRGPDPVDAELAEILKDLPPLDLSADVSWDTGPDEDTGHGGEGRIGSEAQQAGWTESSVEETKTGEKMVLLPYVYFPFPQP